MTKIDKLREVNATLNQILIKLETHIFVENIDTEAKKKISEKQPQVIVEIKQ